MEEKQPNKHCVHEQNIYCRRGVHESDLRKEPDQVIIKFMVMPDEHLSMKHIASVCARSIPGKK